jgi:glutaredoxin
MSSTSKAPDRTSWKSLVVILAVVLGSSSLWAWWQEEGAARTLLVNSHRGSLTLYTTSDCPYCAKARAWLDGHGITWRECNVDLNATCKQAYEARGAPGVPLVNANDQWHLGFDPVWVSEVLK